MEKIWECFTGHPFLGINTHSWIHLFRVFFSKLWTVVQYFLFIYFWQVCIYILFYLLFIYLYSFNFSHVVHCRCSVALETSPNAIHHSVYQLLTPRRAKSHPTSADTEEQREVISKDERQQRAANLVNVFGLAPQDRPRGSNTARIRFGTLL